MGSAHSHDCAVSCHACGTARKQSWPPMPWSLAAGVAPSAAGAAEVPGLLRLSAEEKALKEGERQGL